MWVNTLLIIGTAVVVACLATLIANLVVLQRAIRYEIAELPALDSPAFLRLLSGLIGLRLVDGNYVQLLKNGHDAFPAIFDAVRRAERSVTFENYIYWSGQVGHDFAQLLADKAVQGVQVHVVLDWVGSMSMDSHAMQLMSDAGVEVHRYHRPRLGDMHRLNHRTHRRELVVDGRVAFTGGIGFGDKWLGDGDSKGHWRDNHYELHGPIVGELQLAFADNWLKTSGEVLIGEGYFPELSPCGDQLAGILCSGPKERTSNGRLLILMLLAGAARAIRIEQAYFVADRHVRRALMDAARRGVTVEILLPSDKIDIRLVRRASRATWERLLQAGIRIYEYQPAMLHVKAILIDDQWALVGSANLDFRSLYRNDEIYLAVRDSSFTSEHIECFERDKGDAVEITLAAWRSRSTGQRLLDRAAALLSTQL